MLKSLVSIQQRSFGYRPKQVPFQNWTIVRDDFVEVVSGRYKKQQGKVIKVLRDKNEVVVKGVNLKFKVVDDEEFQRRKKTIQKEFPIHISNVSLIDPQLNEPCKVQKGFLEDGTKVRISKKTGALIPKPDRSALTYLNRTKARETGLYDTEPNAVLEKTYEGEDFFKISQEFDEYIRMKEETEQLLVFPEGQRSTKRVKTVQGTWKARIVPKESALGKINQPGVAERRMGLVDTPNNS